MYELMFMCFVLDVWFGYGCFGLDIWMWMLVKTMFGYFEKQKNCLNIDVDIVFVSGGFLHFQRKLCLNFQFFCMHMFRGSLLSFIESLL